MKNIKYMNEKELMGLQVKLKRDVTTMSGMVYAKESIGKIVHAFHGFEVCFEECPYCKCKGAINFKNKEDLSDAVEVIKNNDSYTNKNCLGMEIPILDKKYEWLEIIDEKTTEVVMRLTNKDLSVNEGYKYILKSNIFPYDVHNGSR